MSPTPEPLDRLLRAAARAPRAELPPPSTALVTRVLAERRRRPAFAEWATLIPWMRGGFAVACVVLTAVVVFAMDTVQRRDAYRLDDWNALANNSWIP